MTAFRLHWFVLHMLAYLGAELDTAYRAQDWDRVCSLCTTRMLVFRSQARGSPLVRCHLGDCPLLCLTVWEGVMTRCPALDSISG